MSLSQLFIVLAIVLFVLGGFDVLSTKDALVWGSASFAAGHLALPSIGR